MRDRGLGGQHHRADVDVQKRVDVGETHLGHRAAAGDAGIVDEDVEPAEPLDRRLDRAAHRRRVGAVGLEREAAPALASICRTTSAARSAERS